MVTGTPTIPWTYRAAAEPSAGVIGGDMESYAAGTVGAVGGSGSIDGNCVGTIGGALASLRSMPNSPAPGSTPSEAALNPAHPTTATARKRSDGLTGAARPERCGGSCPSAW